MSWKVQQLNQWRVLLFSAMFPVLADWAVVKLSSSESDSNMSRAADAIFAAILHLAEIETHSVIDQRLRLGYSLDIEYQFMATYGSKAIVAIMDFKPAKALYWFGHEVVTTSVTTFLKCFNSHEIWYDEVPDVCSI